MGSGHATEADNASATERLKRSEELFARTFNQNPVPMVITHGETLRFTAVNQRFLDMTGYWRSEVIGHSSDELGLWPDPEERRRVGERLQANGGTPLVQGAVRAKGGRLVACLVGFQLLDVAGERSVLSVLVPLPE